MEEWQIVVVGLLFTWVAGELLVPLGVNKLKDGMVIPAISDDPKVESQWRLLIDHRDGGGAWVGRAERLVFFGAMLCHTWEIAAAWVVFKVGAKWQAWSNITRVPAEVGSHDTLVTALGRRAWAGREYATLVLARA